MPTDYNEAERLDAAMRELMQTESFCFNHIDEYRGMTIAAIFDSFCRLARDKHTDVVTQEMKAIRKRIDSGVQTAISLTGKTKTKKDD